MESQLGGGQCGLLVSGGGAGILAVTSAPPAPMTHPPAESAPPPHSMTYTEKAPRAKLKPWGAQELSYCSYLPSFRRGEVCKADLSNKQG